MLIEMINHLRDKLERALCDKEVDKDEVLRLSVELDEYIVKYMESTMTDKNVDKANSKLYG